MMTRRKFLFASLATLLSACLPKSKNSPDSTPTGNSDLSATQGAEAAATSQAQVAATSQARSPEIFQQEMEKIPHRLRESAVRLEMHFEGLNPTFSSGTVIHYDGQVVYVLTAGHTANDIARGQLYNIKLNQIHKGKEVDIQATNKNVGVSSNWEGIAAEFESPQPDSTDNGIIAIATSQDIGIEPFGHENLRSHASLSTSDQLHALSFTSAAEAQGGVFPLTFNITTYPGTEGLTGKNGDHYAAGAISQGTSGSLVTNEGVGVGLVIGGSTTGIYINPLEDISSIMEDARSKIAEMATSKAIEPIS